MAPAPVERGEEFEVLEGAALEIVVGQLEADADFLEVFGTPAPDRFSKHVNAALESALLTGGDLLGRALAGPRRTEKTEDFALADVETQILHRGYPSAGIGMCKISDPIWPLRRRWTVLGFARLAGRTEIEEVFSVERIIDCDVR